MISFNDVVSHLTADVFDTATAAKAGLNGAQDLYHFQMGIREHGEINVVNETALVLRERYRCSYTEAVSMASYRVQGMLELSDGQDTFRTVRERLNKNGKACRGVK